MMVYTFAHLCKEQNLSKMDGNSEGLRETELCTASPEATY